LIDKILVNADLPNGQAAFFLTLHNNVACVRMLCRRDKVEMEC